MIKNDCDSEPSLSGMIKMMIRTLLMIVGTDHHQDCNRLTMMICAMEDLHGKAQSSRPPSARRSYIVHYTLFFIRNLAKGLVLKVPYFRTSLYQILVLKVP